MQAPLQGIRVIEISHMVMGPACGMILAQLGADVIKVEPPAGDKTRSLGGMGTSFFPLFNRGKRSVTLELSSERDRQVLDGLLSGADVFIENFRDETIAGLGLASETVSQRHPHLIMAAHKGFLSGPYEHRPALDEVVQMMSGLAYMTGSREEPLRVGASMNDIMGGMFGAIGILAALIDRGSTGKGAEVRIGLFENCLFAVAQHMVQYQLTGVPPPPMTRRVHSWPVYDIFDTADGRRLFVGVTTEGAWRSFCREFGLDELLADPALETTTDRINARPRLIPLIGDRLAALSCEDLEHRLDALGIPFSPINAPEDMFDDPHVRRPGGLVGLVMPDGRRIETPALPLEFNGSGLVAEQHVPALGEHTGEVLGNMGLEHEQPAAKVE